ncbi:MBOAT family O-acyltransferase [Algibacter miyuki]|uniref:MBOAT family O-acyltransferase n=1 Tax=Algibacter miyuki TaxID=1306933 RepID=A0ABV5H1X1_9FLAO|nr:MBOAT family O-acyltransferase [Algibacter miyuki]MDN3666499.1 MBOAT family O-acyltransferase [Algibacter miyuki]
MIFNSFTFLIFFVIVFIAYWAMQYRIKMQNTLILLSSYVFYGWWDYRFLGLIIFSTLVDFYVAKKIDSEPNKREKKQWLVLSLVSNLGMLVLFKYFNFFSNSWAEAWGLLGLEMSQLTLNVILPVGISFYTFQTLSYTIDVYRGNLKSTNNIINFGAYVAFFPQLVAGPIERATHLLSQFKNRREFNYEKAVSGLQLFIWGLFKKVVIADSCAVYCDAIFENYEQLNSATLILASIYFAFQIYGDFSGYSDMAIGLARLLGFDLKTNFKYPYFSRDIAEFWRKWHISLSTWFRDYLYIPLGGSKGTIKNQIRNVFIIFIVSGFWHGANWTYVIWGALNACYFLPLLLLKRNRKNLDDITVSNSFTFIKQLVSIALTFGLTCFAWVFFRAPNISIAINYINKIGDLNFGIEYLSIERYSVELMLLISIFVLVEWFSRFKEQPISGKYAMLKLTLVLMGIVVLGSYSNPKDFIYFQF